MGMAELKIALEAALRACRRKSHALDDLGDDNQTELAGPGVVIIPGSDTRPGWDQLAPPSNPDYTTGGEQTGSPGGGG